MTLVPQAVADDRDLSPLVQHFRDVDRRAPHRLTQVSKTAKMMALSGIVMASLAATDVQAAPDAPQLSPVAQARVVDYTPYVPVVPVAVSTSHKTLAVHLERSFGYNQKSLMNAYERHAETAAGILNNEADKSAGRDVDVKLVAGDLYSWSNTQVSSTNLDTIKDVLEKASVVSNSDKGTGYTSVNPLPIWEKSDAVFVHAAGNSGYSGLTPLSKGTVPQEFGPLQMADTALRVGASDGDGVKGYSAANGPDLVARNPFDSGLKVGFYRFGDQYKKELQDQKDLYVDQMATGFLHQKFEQMTKGKTVSYEDEEKIINAWRAKPEIMNALNRSSGAQFDKIVDKLEKGTLFGAALNSGLGSASHQVSSALGVAVGISDKTYLEKLTEQKAVGDIQGTSFTAPAVAGMVAGQREMHPELSGADVTVAALLAASERPIANPNGVLGTAPTPNDRGLLFDPVRSGFGEIDRVTFAKKVAQMAELKQNNPDAVTQQTILNTAASTPKAGDQAVTLPVGENNTALRNTLLLRFDQDKPIPETVFLTSPQGARYEVPLSENVNGGSMATTSAFLGSATQGNWKLEFDEPDAVLKSASMQVPSVKQGGLVDQMIDIQTGKKPVPSPKVQNTLGLN